MEEKQIIDSIYKALETLKITYDLDSKLYKTNRGIMDISKIVQTLGTKFPNIDITPKKMTSLLETEVWQLFLKSDEEDEERESNRTMLENAWKKLCKERFSETDRNIWGNLKWTLDSNGTAIVIASTGNGNEYRVIGCKAHEIQSAMAGIIVDGEPLLKKIENQIVDNLVDLTIFGSSINVALLSGEYLPASCCQSLIFMKSETDSNGKFAGYRLTSDRKISVKDYIEASLTSFYGDIDSYIEKVEYLSNDPEVATYKFIPIIKNDKPYFHVENYLNQTLDNPEITVPIFKAWLGSTLDAKNKGKQLVWIRTAGNNGWSQFTGSLADWWGTSAKAINGKSMTNQFGLSKLENKRMVIIGDCKNQKLIQSEFVHNLTGGDFVDVEKKGQNSWSTKLFGKLMVVGNVSPEIQTDELNQTTRLLYFVSSRKSEERFIELGLGYKDEQNEFQFRGDDTLPVRLAEHMDGFMSHCYEVYKEMCPKGGNIPIPREMKENTENTCSDPKSASLEALVNAVCEFDKNGSCDAASLINCMKFRGSEFNVNMSDTFVLSAVNTYLMNNGINQTRKRVSNGDKPRQVRIYQGIKIRKDFETFGKSEFSIENQLKQFDMDSSETNYDFSEV